MAVQLQWQQPSSRVIAHDSNGYSDGSLSGARGCGHDIRSSLTSPSSTCAGSPPVGRRLMEYVLVWNSALAGILGPNGPLIRAHNAYGWGHVLSAVQRTKAAMANCVGCLVFAVSRLWWLLQLDDLSLVRVTANPHCDRHPSLVRPANIATTLHHLLLQAD